MATVTLLPPQSHFTHRIDYTYTDVKALTSGTAYSLLQPTTAAASATTNPAYTRCEDALMVVTTAFASTGDTITLVAEVGWGSNTAKIIPQTTIKTAACIEQTWASVPVTFNAADTIDVIFTAGTEAITVLTAGAVSFFLKLRDISTVIPTK